MAGVADPIPPIGGSIRRVAKNAAIPMAASLLNKLLDFGFAIFMLRTLGPTEIGRYTWAVLVVGYFDILMNFGLGILLTRDVARSPEAADRYLGAAALTRVALWLVCLGAAVAIAGPLAEPLDLTPAMGLTLAVLTLGIGISNLSGLVSALFNAREMMEYPALVTVFTTLAKIGLGVPVLALGYGIIGLATVAVVVNTMTGMVLVALLLRVLGRPGVSVSPRFAAGLVATSFPLMLNNLLATVFFRIDGLLLRGFWGDTVLGWYSTPYKFIDGLNVIPSSLTLALFPMFSRISGTQLESSRTHPPTQPSPDPRNAKLQLATATALALKVLLGLAIPISLGTTLLAEPIIRLFAGEAFLPHAAIALQVLIWFLPLSFANGLLQYVLIAVEQQRLITAAFVAAVAFNVAGNLLAIPPWGYVGAAAMTVLSELLLLALFWRAVGRHVGAIGIVALTWRPVAASAAIAPVVWLIAPAFAPGAVLAGVAIYGAVFLALGGLSRREREILSQALPLGAPVGPSPLGELRGTDRTF